MACGNAPEKLIQRLEAIAQSIRTHPDGLALLGLGSCAEQGRLDRFSDLDFYAIVAEGAKQGFIDDLAWLSDVAPVKYCFRNSEDGYKLMYKDGIFCEFAVFTLAELRTAQYAPGKFIWRCELVPEGLALPTKPEVYSPADDDYLLNELLTNLYVGLGRYHRGELVSAMRFIQVFALDRLLSLLHKKHGVLEPQNLDPFNIERRAEARHPKYAELLHACLGDVKTLPQSAQAMLDFIKTEYTVEAAICDEIQSLIDA